jgi:hypothetical protein
MLVKDQDPKPNENLNLNTQTNENLSWYSKVFNFLKHKTIWRIVAIAVAVASTVFSGGATIPLTMLILTFVASMIGVISKTVQIRTLEKYRLQKSFLEKIKEKRQELAILKNKHKEIFHALEKPKTQTANPEIHQIKTSNPSERKSFLRTLRDVGLENALSFVTFGSVANFVGFTTYVFSVGSSIKSIKDEFDIRVKHDLEISYAKRDINDLSKDMQIMPYKKTRQLSNVFRNEIIEYETIKKLSEKLEDRASSISIEDIDKEYQKIKETIEKDITFHMPEKVPFSKKLWDAVRPWNMEPVRIFKDISNKDIYSIKSQDEHIHNHKILHPEHSPTPARKLHGRELN